MPKDINGALGFQHYGVDKINYQLNQNAKPQNISLSGQNFKLARNVLIDGNIGQLVIQVELFEKNSDIYPFYLSFIIFGIFTNNGLTEEQFKRAVEYNGTALLFPFIRSTVADITKIANHGNPLLLPTINVNALIEDSKK